MLSFKKKSHLSFEINEFVLRVFVASGSDISQGKVLEYPLLAGVIEDGVIRDEMELYELFKQHLPNWGGKRQNVRFFVPDNSVMMRTFEHPIDLPAVKLKSYVEMELGQTIHLPFENPLIDVHDHEPNDGEATLYSAPSEEVRKFIGILDDVHLHSVAVDIRSLASIRFLKHCNALSATKTYLIADWSVNELTISIYSKGELEFLRYQAIDYPERNWNTKIRDKEQVDYTYEGDIEAYTRYLGDPISEIDRISNFFRFSIHKDDVEIDEFIIMGDTPVLDYIGGQIKGIYEPPLTIIDDAFVKKVFPNFKGKHATLLGLAMKEVN